MQITGSEGAIRRIFHRGILALAVVVAAYAANSRSPAWAATDRPAESRRSDDLRRLEEIPIQGEIAMPQVWFVTARDLPRFRDGVPFLLAPFGADLGSRRPAEFESWNRAAWALPDALSGAAGQMHTSPGDAPSPGAKP